MNNYINGFSLLKSEKISEVNGEAFEFIHDKTKAHLVFLKTDDNNKAFAIGFRTPPHDSTGVPHIIEHSVLCGSDKYTTKEPFVDLMKGSLNTFLNAFTYPDKTMYPFSSQNLEDYKNMLGIYMDAVFNPKMRSIKEIFFQEGWHYELADKNAPLALNGVVYSEMKGAYSSPEEILDEEINKALFDNCYKYSSGGNPDVIPSLTYEDFKNFHAKYYHPSNSCIYVYGNIDIEEIMSILDKDYLSKYDYQNINSKIIPTKPLTEEKTVISSYSISEDDDDTDKTYASMSFVMPQDTNDTLTLQLHLLTDILFNSDSAPIRLKLFNENLCQNVESYYDIHKLQPVFNIILQNTSEEKAKKAFDIIMNTMSEISKNGIDKSLINGCININEFIIKENSTIRTGRGVNMAARLFARYFYEKDIFGELKFNDALKFIRANIDNGEFEDIITKNLLENKYMAKIIVNPEKGLSKRKEEKLAKELQEYKSKLSDSELEEIIEANKILKLRQSTPDTKADLATIPKLKVSEIDKNIEKTPLDETKTSNYTLYHYDVVTNKVVYGRIMLDASSITKEDLPYLGLIANSLSILPTQNYSSEEIVNEIMQNMGQITFTENAFSELNNPHACKKYFEINFKAVEEKLPKAALLIKEILYSTKFDDKEKLKQIINMNISRLQSALISMGQVFGFMRLASKFTPAGEFIENSGFYTYYDFLKNQIADFDNSADNLICKLKSVIAKITNSNNTIFAVTGDKATKAVFEKEICSIAKNGVNENTQIAKFVPSANTEGFMTSSNVQYVCMGFNYNELGYKYNGKMEVLRTILDTDYLWNNIRVMGGAYGAPIRLSNDGNMLMGSYRDPNLEKTLDIYRKASEYFGSFNIDKDEFDNYIIGTMQMVDAPKTPDIKCKIAVENKLRNISDEFLQKTRDEILSTDINDIRSFAKLIKDVTDKNIYVVFGNANKIKENKDIFTTIKNA